VLVAAPAGLRVERDRGRPATGSSRPTALADRGGDRCLGHLRAASGERMRRQDQPR